MIKVIDNFIPEDEWNQIKAIVMLPHNAFPWAFAPETIQEPLLKVDPLDGYQFVHTLYNIDRGGIDSQSYSLFDIVQQKLGVKRLDRIKLNLNPKTFFHRKSGFHTDQRNSDDPQHQKTAVFYLNTNDGYTEFEDGSKVDSRANRMVIFDSQIMHRGTTCTNQKTRVVINFNYET